MTKFITVSATGGATTFAFTANGLLGTNRFVVPSGQTVMFELRAKEMWVTGSTFSVAAGLTGIPTGSVPTLTGSFTFNPGDPYFTGSAGFENFLVVPGVG